MTQQNSGPLRARLEALVGSEVGPSRELSIDQAVIDAFAAATGDRQWIHVDERRAAQESPFGGTVAHGMLTLSLAPGLAIELLDLGAVRLVVNYGFDRVRFPAPVPAGSELRMYLTVASLDPVAEGFRITLDVRFELSGRAHQKPPCVARMLFQIYE